MEAFIKSCPLPISQTLLVCPKLNCKKWSSPTQVPHYSGGIFEVHCRHCSVNWFVCTLCTRQRKPIYGLTPLKKHVNNTKAHSRIKSRQEVSLALNPNTAKASTESTFHLELCSSTAGLTKINVNQRPCTLTFPFLRNKHYHYHDMFGSGPTNLIVYSQSHTRSFFWI